MEISPNVDEMLIQQMSGQKLEPLPEKPAAEVPRETKEVAHQDPLAPIPSDVAAESISPIEKAPEKPKVEPKTNEYGDKAELAGKTEQLEPETNEYGLEQETPKTYSKAEMDEYANRLMRERVARFERNNQQQQPTQQQQQQAAQQGFQYDENSNQDWQQQLEQFVLQVADKREHTKAVQLQQAVEQERIQRFESKFKQGMSQFKDYHEVVGGKNVTDAMLMAASDISNPAALFYAAAKRMPDELAKISQIENPYAQAAAIGRLDAKLRKEPTKVSSAPKPVSQTKTDTTNAYQPKPIVSNELDDLLVADNKNRLAQLASRRR